MYTFNHNINNVFGMIHRGNLIKQLETLMNEKEFRFYDKDYCMVSMSREEIFDKLEYSIGKVYVIDSMEFFVVSPNNEVIISGFVSTGETNKSSVLRLNFHATSQDMLKFYLNQTKKIFDDMRNDENTIAVKWYYDNGKIIKHEIIPEIFEDKIYQESYPYIENIENMIEGFMNTPEPVLIVMGKPGTGKTRLIRYIIKKMSMKYRLKKEESISDDYYGDNDPEDSWPKVAYATDAAILTKDQIFIDLLSGETFALILEDMDVNLASRADGNEMMNKMLSVSDGFLCNIKTKIIITTNIQNVGDIDQALLRPGRCFAVIETREIDYEESTKLAKVMKIEDDLPYKENYTLAEIYSIRNRKQGFTNAIARKVGFNLSRQRNLLREIGIDN